MTTLVFDDLTTGSARVVAVDRVLIAGFTGRDASTVDAHISELAAQGVPVPERTPCLFTLDGSAVHQTSDLVVAGSETSGEAEPVLVVAGGDRLLTIGSDHTDRAVERVDMTASKRACGKVVGTACIPLPAVDNWDDIRVRSWIEHGSMLYQEGSLGSLLPPSALLDLLHTHDGLTVREGDLLYLGTLPAIGGIRPSPTFRAEMVVQGTGHTLSLDYRVTDISSTARDRLAKPELEFTPVDRVAWTPIPGGVEGQAERILSHDPATGISTRMLRFEPGTDTTELGVLRHDFWEEVYIVEGALHDLTLSETFGAGTYACRPPGMPHGPWRSATGCTTFEVRYPAI